MILYLIGEDDGSCKCVEWFIEDWKIEKQNNYYLKISIKSSFWFEKW